MYAIAIFVNDNDIMHICIWGSFTFYVAERSWKGKTHAFLIYLYIWKSQEFISREFRAAFKKILCKFFCQTKWKVESVSPSTAQKSGVTMSHCVTLCHTVTHCVTLWHGWRLPKILVHWSKPTPWTLVCHMKEIGKKRNLSFLPKVPSLHFCTFYLFLLLRIFT